MHVTRISMFHKRQPGLARYHIHCAAHFGTLGTFAEVLWNETTGMRPIAVLRTLIFISKPRCPLRDGCAHMLHTSWKWWHRVTTFSTDKMQSHVQTWVSDLEGCPSTILTMHFQNARSFSHMFCFKNSCILRSRKLSLYKRFSLFLGFFLCFGELGKLKMSFLKISIRAVSSSSLVKCFWFFLYC